MCEKIYLGGSCSPEDRTLMVSVAKVLRENFYLVYCPFELKIDNAWDYTQEEWAQKVFDKDVAALDEADIFLMLTPGRKSTAGTNWEQGYAYAKGKKIIVVQYHDLPGQYQDTSLMTYCGCNSFINSRFVEDDILALLRRDKDQKKCRSILT